MDSSAVPTTCRQRPVTGRERGLALGSLGCGLLLAVALVVFAVRNARVPRPCALSASPWRLVGCGGR